MNKFMEQAKLIKNDIVSYEEVKNILDKYLKSA